MAGIKGTLSEMTGARSILGGIYMKKVAVLIDGGFLTKIYEKISLEHPFKIEKLDVKAILKKLFKKQYLTPDGHVNSQFKGLDDEFKGWFPGYAEDQFKKIEAILSKNCGNKLKRNITPNGVINIAKSVLGAEEELFRIYYYDCPPLDKKLVNPISGKEIDFAKSDTFTNANQFHKELAEREYVALRKGETREFGWKLKDSALYELKNSGWKMEARHISANIKQKGLDMRIGLDISVLSMKKIVDKIAIVAGDTDFIPAMKHARKEGVIVTLVDIGGSITSEMKQHSDHVISLDLMKIKN